MMISSQAIQTSGQSSNRTSHEVVATSVPRPLSQRQERLSLSFQEMLDNIEIAFNRPDNRVDIDELRRVLDGYKSDPRDWAKYAYYDMHKYKRNFVEGHEKYNVMIICWGPGTKSCIHDHSGSHCFMKILEGELIESRFAWPSKNQNQENGGQEMSRLSDSRIGKNGVLYINDKVGLHRVENPNLNQTAASLHVYIPPIRTCKAFDQRTGQATDCKLSFYSKRGEITREDEDCNLWPK